MTKTKTKAKVVTLYNHKGGTAKTTTSLNLGHGLAMKGFKVLLVDLDSQANLTDLCGFGGNKIKEEECISNVFLDKKGDTKATVKSVKENLDIIPAFNDTMIGLEFYIQAQLERPGKQLKRVLEPFYEYYDLIILDCPPALNGLTIDAFFVADRLMVPIVSDYLSPSGFYRLEAMLLNKFDIPVSDVIITKHKSVTSIAKAVVKELHEKRPWMVFKNLIRENIHIVESGSGAEKYSIFEYKPNSIGTEDYNNVVNEFVERVKLKL